MAEISINNQAVLIGSQADQLSAVYKESRYGKAVLLLAVPRRVGRSL